MTGPLIANVPATRQAAAIPGRSRRNAVTGKLKTALDAMVWEGLKRTDAAATAGLADSSLRFALRKPHVLAYYRAECDALRNSIRARNLAPARQHRRRQQERYGQGRQLKVLERVCDGADQHHCPGDGQQAPGVVIVIQQVPAQAAATMPPQITIGQPGARPPPIHGRSGGT